MNFLKTHLFSEADSIRNICTPLHHFGVTGFFYIRLYDDGSFIDLSVDLNWAEFYFKKLFSCTYQINEISDSIYLSNEISLWTLNENNKIWQEGREIFGHGNGLTLRFPSNNGFTEIFFYYSTAENYKINEFYLNNLNIFKSFVLYFKEKAKKIIKKAEKDKFTIPTIYNDIFLADKNKLLCVEKNAINKFYSAFDIKKFYINECQYFTYKEAECLTWYAKGKTTAEIGLTLNISKKTVERHLENLKKKSNCNNKVALTKLAVKLGIIDFFNN